MKISGSIYSDKKRPLKEVIEDLAAHQIEMLHVDCNDDLAVFEDIKNIRTWCTLPIDLHIISSDPDKFFPLLIENPVEYITFQYEPLTGDLKIPSEITGRKGIAITTDTPIEIFEEYNSFDFLLVMATVPGQSGGIFDKHNFTKVRQFRKAYPSKSIHVDGGVNGEISFILRNMGVSTSVSGSYLFNGPSIGHALMNLTKREMESQIKIEDFMTPIDEAPVIAWKNCSTQSILETVENGNLGFCLIVDETVHLMGLVSSADIRKALLKKIKDSGAIEPEDLINKNPMKIEGSNTVHLLLQFIKACPIPLMYLPVVDHNNTTLGIIHFTNLIKGEL